MSIKKKGPLEARPPMPKNRLTRKLLQKKKLKMFPRNMKVMKLNHPTVPAMLRTKTTRTVMGEVAVGVEEDREAAHPAADGEDILVIPDILDMAIINSPYCHPY
jgi:hypothetical protein